MRAEQGGLRSYYNDSRLYEARVFAYGGGWLGPLRDSGVLFYGLIGGYVVEEVGV